MAEKRETTHEECNRILRRLGVSGPGFRGDPALDRQYASLRRQYWKWRAGRHRKGNGQ